MNTSKYVAGTGANLCLVALALLSEACGKSGGGRIAGAARPAAPSGVQALVQAGAITLTWNGSNGANEYHVYGNISAGVAQSPSNHVGSTPDTSMLLNVASGVTTVHLAVSASNSAGESALSSEVSVELGAAGIPSDPLRAEQWHLINTGQAGGTPGEDARVLPPWEAGFSGNGVRIAVVDDGVDASHEDLWARLVPGASTNYVNGSTQPTSHYADSAHGTCVAGIAAASGRNGLGGCGAAFGAELVSRNLLENGNSVNLGHAAAHQASSIWISNHSWGPGSQDTVLAYPRPADPIWPSALSTGITQGRGGRGTIYVLAAGNDALNGTEVADNANYDGYRVWMPVIVVGAVGDDGRKASYSENGANVLVAAPSDGRAGHASTTTDRPGGLGLNQTGSNGDYANLSYTNRFSGTSSAAPLASGVIALVLEANPNLTWRDVRVLLARSARRNHPTDSDWALNGAGRYVNHKYGFGVVNAAAAVALSQSWTNLPPLRATPIQTQIVNVAIPDNHPVGVTRSMTVSGSGITRLEHVYVWFSSTNHTYSGDLEIVLTSPTGTKSVLAETHACGVQFPPPYNNWMFGSVRHLDEPADGVWTLRVRDRAAHDVGTFQQWSIALLGH